MNYRPQSEVSMFIWREIVDYYGVKLSMFFAVDDLFSTGRKDDFALAKKYEIHLWRLVFYWSPSFKIRSLRVAITTKTLRFSFR